MKYKISSFVLLLSLALALRANNVLPEINKALSIMPSLPQSVINDLKSVITSFNYNKKLPTNYIKKGQACALGWKNIKACNAQGNECNLSKLREGWGKFFIGGDHHVNIHGWPKKNYFEADVGDLSANNCRNSYRIIYSSDLKDIYLSLDHYKNFIKLR